MRRLSIPTVAIGFFLFTNTAFALSPDCVAKDSSVAEQVKALDCDVRGIAQQMNDGKEMVPAIINHFGKAEYLDEDVAAGTIPQKAWDDFIMGNKTRYALAPNRRGLYGTGGIDTNGFGGGEFNWIMQIQIKDECRDPAKVVTYYNMAKSERFKNWFNSLSADQKVFDDPQDFQQKCFNVDGSPLSSYEGNFEMGDPRCSKFVDFYLDNSKAKIIQDHVIGKAFYIRDRSCIQKITGTPKDVIDFAANNEYMWLTPCGMNAGARAYVNIISSALHKIKSKVPKSVLDKLIANAHLAQITDTSKLDAYERCEAKGTLDDYRNAPDTSPNPYSFADPSVYNNLCQ